MSKIYIKKELISDESIGEIDFDLHEEFGFSYDEHEEFIELTDGRHGGPDAYPIKIDEMIKLLQQMKENGATHVELEYHCDHIGYDVAGYRIRKATVEEIAEHIKEEKAKRAKEQKRLDLLKQLKELDEQPKKEDGYPF